MNIILDVTYLIFGIYTNLHIFYAKSVTQDITSLTMVFTEDRVTGQCLQFLSSIKKDAHERKLVPFFLRHGVEVDGKLGPIYNISYDNLKIILR